MNGTTTDPTVGGYIWSYVGAFFRLNYGYKGKYLAEVSGRYDGSSKFPTNSKWGSSHRHRWRGACRKNRG